MSRSANACAPAARAARRAVTLEETMGRDCERRNRRSGHSHKGEYNWHMSSLSATTVAQWRDAMSYRASVVSATHARTQRVNGAPLS
jgi:hypothetical protein